MTYFFNLLGSLFYLTPATVSNNVPLRRRLNFIRALKVKVTIVG